MTQASVPLIPRVSYERDRLNGELRASEDEQRCWVMIGSFLRSMLADTGDDRATSLRFIARIAADYVPSIADDAPAAVARGTTKEAETARQLATLDRFADHVDESGAHHMGACMRSLLGFLRDPDKPVPKELLCVEFEDNRRPLSWARYPGARTTLVSLFAALERFRSAHCETALGRWSMLHARTPQGTDWIVDADGELALDEAVPDKEDDAPHEVTPARRLRVTFHSEGETPQRGTIRAVRPTVDPESYPCLSAAGPRGVSDADLAELSAVADALPRFVDAHRDQLSARLAHDSVSWTDEATGVQFDYHGYLEL
jgi:hypothetical protein